MRDVFVVGGVVNRENDIVEGALGILHLEPPWGLPSDEEVEEVDARVALAMDVELASCLVAEEVPCEDPS